MKREPHQNSGPAKAAVTLADLGRILGLDKSSISLALKGSGKISEATTKRVRKAAARLGYRPNLAARQLRKGGMKMAGLVLHESFVAIDNAVVVRTIQHIAKRLSENGVIFSIISSSDLAKINCGSCGLPYVPDALFVWGDVPCDDVKAVTGSGIPCIVLDPNHESYRNFDGCCVRLDNRDAASKMTLHLAGRGVVKMLFVEVCSRHLGHQERAKGARDAWLAKMPARDANFCRIDEVTDELLKSFCGNEGTAIYCSNDAGAMNIWHKLHGIGINVPDDVFLAGFDGEAYGENIGLTTSVLDCRTFADVSCETMMEILAAGGKSCLQRTVPVGLRIGRTTMIQKHKQNKR